jgi:hypothetical protein
VAKQEQNAEGGQTCNRCGAMLKLATSLPKRFESPPYDIFRCAACGFIEWVAQKTS